MMDPITIPIPLSTSRTFRPSRSTVNNATNETGHTYSIYRCDSRIADSSVGKNGGSHRTDTTSLGEEHYHQQVDEGYKNFLLPKLSPSAVAPSVARVDDRVFDFA